MKKRASGVGADGGGRMRWPVVKILFAVSFAALLAWCAILLRTTPSHQSMTMPTSLPSSSSTTSTTRTSSSSSSYQETSPRQRKKIKKRKRFTKEQCNALLPTWLRLDGKDENILTRSAEAQIYSQNGEDGITRALLQMVDIPNKYYVEFGVEDGSQCNTRFLREQQQDPNEAPWSGLMMDGGYEDAAIGLRRESIHPNNVVSLLQKYQVPQDFGLLSEDTDYADYYIWRNIFEASYRPRIVIGEVNGNFYNREAGTVHPPPDNKPRMWDSTKYFGLSALALRYLWNSYGYLMVYCGSKMINCFGVRADLLGPNFRRAHEPNKVDTDAVRDAQACLWDHANSTLNSTWPIHQCYKSRELFHPIEPNGQVNLQKEFRPLFMRLLCGQT